MKHHVRTGNTKENIYSGSPVLLIIAGNLNIFLFLPGQPASFTDQGQSHTCASHSIGMGITELVNDFGLDVDQNLVIQALIR